ncbi:hypothetical protein ACLOJK_039313 [Asimina triloba]
MVLPLKLSVSVATNRREAGLQLQPWRTYGRRSAFQTGFHVSTPQNPNHRRRVASLFSSIFEEDHFTCRDGR